MNSVATETIEYRGHRPGDEAAILPFLRECGYQPEDRFWRWINTESPDGQTLIELALVEGRVVGHYAVLPRWIFLEGRKVKSGLAIHAAVHPEFRGLSILVGLFRRILERCRQAGLPFIYAFPNDQIWLVYQRIFQWRPIGEIQAFEFPLHRLEVPMSLSAGEEGISFREPIFFDERYDRWDPAAVLTGLTFLWKDRRYLTWRYADHPKVRYRLLEAQEKDGSLRGFLVLKLYEKEGIRYGHLVEMGMGPGSIDQFSALVLRALWEFKGQGVQIASCWTFPRSPFGKVLQEIGFGRRGFITHCGVRLIDPDFPTDPLAMERWQMGMGDSDAF